MAKKDARIDAYIKNSADFAKPILNHFRALVHKTCPDVVETMKWSFPHFDYKGIMCSMASFKEHCSVGFWKATLMKDAEKLTAMANTQIAMGHLGRISSLKDLPKDSLLISYIKESMKLNDNGIKLPAKAKSPKDKTIAVPDHFTKALKTSKQAWLHFEKFSYSQKKEYVDWVTEAKTEVTRDKRMATALEWLSEGKIRNWKYLK